MLASSYPPTLELQGSSSEVAGQTMQVSGRSHPPPPLRRLESSLPALKLAGVGGGGTSPDHFLSLAQATPRTETTQQSHWILCSHCGNPRTVAGLFHNLAKRCRGFQGNQERLEG
jgi:hypothetical protein